MKTVSATVYREWKDLYILHDEDEWNGKYLTWGQMWKGEGYLVEVHMMLSPSVYEKMMEERD